MKIEELTNKMNEKNTYMHIFKCDKILRKEIKEELKESFIYDQVMRDK